MMEDVVTSRRRVGFRRSECKLQLNSIPHSEVGDKLYSLSTKSAVIQTEIASQKPRVI